MPERRRLKLGSGLGLVGVSSATATASAAAAQSAAALSAAALAAGPGVLGDEDQVPAMRLCGRCRKRPSADPALYPKARREWWLCPSCHEALFGPLIS